MEKIDIVLVVLNREALENAIKNLDLAKVNPIAIVADNEKNKSFSFGEKNIPMFPFIKIQKRIEEYKNFTWLIDSCLNDNDDFRKLKKFLKANGISSDKIFSVEDFYQPSPTWSANVRYVEKFGADFFATGNEYMRDDLHIKFIPCVREDKNFSRGGVNLSDVGQDLYQNYLTAKRVFEHVERGTVKFVLIGLTPESFLCDNSKNFSNFKTLLNLDTTTEQADLNFDKIRRTLNSSFSLKKIADWEDEIKIWNAAAAKKNFQILKDYIELCHENDAKPVGVIFPFSQAARKNYSEEYLKIFREKIHQLEENHDFVCVDMFDLDISYEFFRDVTHLNAKGAKYVSTLLSLHLYEKGFIPIENFCNMTYEYFQTLSIFAPVENYNSLMKKIFETSAQLIRRKNKIKLGFVVYLSAQWSGDDLYNIFATDKSFKTSVFLCKRFSNSTDNELFQEDFLRGIKEFQYHGLNVVPVESLKKKVPEQDVIIFLTPYFTRLPNAFKPSFIKAKTLITHIPYSFDIAIRSHSYYNSIIFHTAWKIFFSSVIGLEVYAKNNSVELPRGFFSGYPRTDIFFDKNSNLNFDWKMAQPDAKKIIWAPHWSIGTGVRYATFKWNYQFMYDFAKAHPETSWVLKPHPGLFFAAVEEKIFPSLEAFEEYLQKWNDLPNAQVYTGGYYQAIFATSDGMIHDSGSFIAEYQFVDKPMIFLTREGEKFNDLGSTILNQASYLVDGKDLDAIAQTMQKVFIEGDDYKAAERKEIFDNYLNYPKFNGMLASKFIYKSIADELKEASK